MGIIETQNSYNLTAPFPVIEVIRWRPKLRNSDGKPKIDERGMELYGREKWFSFDNRRLFCSQKKTCQLLAEKKINPTKVVNMEVIEVDVRDSKSRNRELRKFRTACEGRCVEIGHREEPNLPRWDWRTATGQPPVEEEEHGSPLYASGQPRRGNPLRKEPKYNPNRDKWTTSSAKQAKPINVWTSSFIFLGVYCLLRISVALYRHYHKVIQD